MLAPRLADKTADLMERMMDKLSAANLAETRAVRLAEK